MAPIIYLPHVRLSMTGSIGTPDIEEWSNTVRFDTGEYVPSFENLVAGLAALEPVATTWFGGQSACISNVARLRTLKLNWILQNGRQRDNNTPQRDLNVAGGIGSSTGTQTPNPHWYQTQALTLRTGLQRGRGHSGRIFPPLTAALPAGTTPYIAEAAATGMATAFAQFLTDACEALSTSLGGGVGVIVGVQPVVAAAGDGAAGSFKDPLLVPITGVVVDRVGDVQHRRNRQVTRLESPRSVVTGVEI